MSIKELIEQEAKNNLNKLKKEFPLLKDEDIYQRLEEESFDFAYNQYLKFDQEFPYLQEVKYFDDEKVIEEPFYKKSLSEYLKEMKKINKKSKLPFEKKYWSEEIKKLKVKKENYKAEYKILKKLMINEWEKNLFKLVEDWEFEQINKFRNKYLEMYRERLGLLEEFKKILDNMSMEPGYLWDLSKGKLTTTDVELLKKWLEFINSKKEIKELCELLGRTKQFFQSSNHEKVLISEKTNTFIPDINSKEEIIGIKLAKDLEYMLPQEIALMSDEELSILFDLKYLEGKLMCFDFQGMNLIEEENEIEKYEETEEQEKGPIIICVDTSGSMHGAPENIAKAMTLALSSQANREDRDCLLINFSTKIDVMELGHKINIKKIFEFLKKSFYGGTDVAPALDYAVKMIEKNKYKNADILVVSDFIMRNIQEETLKKIKDIRLEDNKLYSLCIGNEFLDNSLKEIFESQWVYNPNKTSIELIKQVKESFE